MRGFTVETELAPFSLAAARALFRAPRPRTRAHAGRDVRACGRPEATSLGLCAEHRVELFG